MTREITDSDIIEALQGTPSATGRASGRDIVEALQGGRNAADRNLDHATVEALNGNFDARIATEGELPLQRRGDELEAVTIWAAKEASSNAVASLAQALMRADGTKGIYAAESEAKAIAEEAYSEAAKSTPYEDTRQETVQRVANKLAEQLTRRLKTPSPKPAGVSEAKPPLQRRVTKSLVTGQDIVHYS